MALSSAAGLMPIVSDTDMPDELIRTAAIGVGGTLLAVELVAAARSWYDARTPRRMGDNAGPILLSQPFALRDHFAQRRHTLVALRGQYAVLRSDRYGRQLRSAIGRVRPGPFSEPVDACPECRGSRFKGQAHCVECGRRLIAPATAATI